MSTQYTGKRPVIFCDFDGTITVNDNIIAIVKHFQPEGWEQIVQGIVEQTITIQDGIGRLFALLPSSQKDEIIRFALQNMKIRNGFPELLLFCKEQQIEFLVTSGGIDFFVYPTLAPYDIKQANIYCNESNFSTEYINILWPFACDEDCDNHCGMCKTTIIRRYSAEQYTRILIGDSITDFAGAKLADVVFARSHLADQCEKLGMSYYAYEDFYTVISQLKELIA